MFTADTNQQRTARSTNPIPGQQQVLKVMHDISNALGRINFYCEQLSEAVDNDACLDRQDVAAMTAECTFCIDLIRSLTANPQSLLGHDHCGQCDADVVAAFAVESHQYLFSDDIAIVYTTTAETMPACKMSQSSLYRCISNLLINARQAIPERGTIGIDINAGAPLAGAVCSSCQQRFDGEYVQISVSDTGLGIFEHDRENIFKPHVTSKVEGSGMGLSIVHELIHQCGGHLLLESEIGSGSRFTLCIPKMDKPRADQAALASELVR